MIYIYITQRCSDDIGLKYGIVTYDLNAAKPAFQMQITEIHKYDKLFIMPGLFHLEMSFFKGLGKLINESGGPAIIIECGVLASDSLKGFLSGKNFNHCKCIHPMYALALETLHFNAFLHLSESRRELFDKVHLMNVKESWKKVESSTLFIECVLQYRKSCIETKTGKHSATAQFWYMYIEFLHHFHRLERSIRTNKDDDFTRAMTLIIVFVLCDKSCKLLKVAVKISIGFTEYRQHPSWPAGNLGPRCIFCQLH